MTPERMTAAARAPATEQTTPIPLNCAATMPMTASVDTETMPEATSIHVAKPEPTPRRSNRRYVYPTENAAPAGTIRDTAAPA